MLGLIVATAILQRPYRPVVLLKWKDYVTPYQLLDNGDALLSGNRLWHNGKIRMLVLPTGLPERAEVRKIGPHGEYAIGENHVESGALSVSVDQAYLFSNFELKNTGSDSAFICDITNTGKLLWYEQNDYSSAGYPPPNPSLAYMLLPNGKNVEIGIGENLRVNKKGVIAYDIPLGQFPVQNIEPTIVKGPVGAVNPFYAQDYGAYTLFKGKTTKIGAGIVTDINEAGTIAGYYMLPRDLVGAESDEELVKHITGWIWSNGHRTEVRSARYPHLEILAINNHGDAVGTMGHAFPDPGRAFLYQQGRLIDLDAVVRLSGGLRLRRAVDINDRGDILCEASKGEDEPTVPVLLRRG
jgi:hypothetical protein